MTANWRDGLVNAFPVPKDKPKRGAKKATKNATTEDSEPVEEVEEPVLPPFQFLDLPSELRNKIYDLILLSKSEHRGLVGKRKRSSKLCILLTSQQLHQEASYVLYTSNCFRVFPIQDFTATPAIEEIPQRYRSLVTNLEMVVGSSWTSPPKSWCVTVSLAKCLKSLKSVQTLRIFVELDPSHPMFAKYRISYDFYTNFCGNLLKGVLAAMPQLIAVELDGNPGVDVKGPLVSRLRSEIEQQRKSVHWGVQNGWAYKV